MQHYHLTVCIIYDFCRAAWRGSIPHVLLVSSKVSAVPAILVSGFFQRVTAQTMCISQPIACRILGQFLDLLFLFISDCHLPSKPQALEVDHVGVFAISQHSTSAEGGGWDTC